MVAERYQEITEMPMVCWLQCKRGARFSHKDKQKFIDPFTQLISGLCQVSQLYPRIKEQEESSGVI